MNSGTDYNIKTKKSDSATQPGHNNVRVKKRLIPDDILKAFPWKR
jgi:hypothetical protein